MFLDVSAQNLPKLPDADWCLGNHLYIAILFTAQLLKMVYYVNAVGCYQYVWMGK